MLSINTLLKSLIGLFSLTILSLLSFETWTAWTASVNAERIALVSDAATPMFKVLNALRIDRANTLRMLGNPAITLSLSSDNIEIRRTELSALGETITALKQFEFPEKPATIAELQGLLNDLTRLHPETLAAIAKPLAERPADLAATFEKTENGILTRLTALNESLSRSIKLQDPIIDQLYDMYGDAWAARIATGEASLLVSNNMIKQSAPADALPKQYARMAEAEAALASLNRIAAGLPLTPALRAKLDGFKGGILNEAARKMMTGTLTSFINGEKTDMTSDKWTDFVLQVYRPIVDLAVGALDMASEHADSVRIATQTRLIVLGLVLIVALVVMAVAIVLVGKRIIGPINAMTGCMKRIVEGNYNEAIPGIGRSDEIGGMASAVEVFRASLVRNRELEAETAITRDETERQRKAMLADLAARFETNVGGIVDAVAASARDLDGAAKVMSRSAVDTSHRSTAVAAAAEEASVNVSVVASSAEELGASVAEISRQVQQSTEMSSAAVEEARATATIVGELSTAANRISDVLSLISTIAGQTNLLALNATIEAARAGEAGRGFAVVASEVKELATQTAKATAEISAQIGAIQSSTERAVGAIGGIAETIQSMNQVATTISASVVQQGAATSEIVRSISQASEGTTEVTDNITGVARAANDTGAAASQVLGASAALAKRASDLRTEVDRFVATVRAA